MIDRQPVAGGAEVMLELVSDDGPATYYQYSYRAADGTAQAFYRMVVQMKKADGSVGYEKQWIASRIDELKFDDHRVSLFHPDLYDCVVVTLELDAAAPKVHVDRFLSSYGFGSVHAALVGVDELVLSDPSQRLRVKKLKRAADGTWRLAGIPYEKDVSSHVMTVPLPSVSEMLKQEAQSAVKRVAEGEGWTSLQAVSAQADRDLNDLQYRASLERVQTLQGLFSQPRLVAFPAPVLVMGRETPLPYASMPPERSPDCNYHPFNLYSASMSFARHRLDSSRPTLSELPCYDTDYDRAVGELSAAYGYCQEYFATRLAKSMHGVDDVAFLDLIEWEMKKGDG